MARLFEGRGAPLGLTPSHFPTWPYRYVSAEGPAVAMLGETVLDAAAALSTHPSE